MSARPGTVLAIDAGSSKTRVALVGLDGTVVSMVSAPVAGSASSTLDPAVLWASVAALARQVTDGADVVAIGVAAQLGTAFLDDDGGQAVALLWPDTRAAEQAARLAHVLGPEGERLAGRPITAELAVSKVLWMREHGRASAMLALKDWLVMCMTGRRLTDETHASYSGMFDVRQRRWSDELATAAGVGIATLPEVAAAVEQAGPLTPLAAQELGLSAGIPVAVGGPDGTLGAVGAGAVVPKVTVDVAGTTDVLLSVTDRPPSTVAGGAVVNAHAAPGLWSLGGPTGLTGGAVAWMAEVLGFDSVDAAFADLGDDVRALPPGTDGVTLDPALGGTRFPFWRTDATGTIVGLRRSHTRAHLLRAAIEGGVFVVGAGLEALQGVTGMDEVVVVGGGAADDAWLQLRSDAWGLPVRTVREPAATLVGAAMTGAVAAGAYDDLVVAGNAMVHLTRALRPDPARSAALAAARHRWERVASVAAD